MSSTIFDDSSKVERVANFGGYERAQVEVTGKNIFRVDDYESAAVKASRLGKNIFVTTGNHNSIFDDSSKVERVANFGGLNYNRPHDEHKNFSDCRDARRPRTCATSD